MPDPERLERLCRALEISADELLGLPVRTVPAPVREGQSVGLSEVVASVAAGAPRFDVYSKGGKRRTYHFREEFLKYLGWDERDPERFIPVRVADQVSGDSMVPTIQPKALLLVDRGARPEPRGVRHVRDVRDGAIYLCYYDEGLAVKRVFVGEKVLMLWSDNPLHTRRPLRLDEVEELNRLLVGRVVWVGQMLEDDPKAWRAF